MVITGHLQCRVFPKGNTQGGGQRHPRRVHQDSKPVSLVCVFTFVWGCHTESPANALREVSRVSLQLTAEGRGLPGDQYQFWCWCPFKLERNRSSASAQRANYHVCTRPSIYHDLEHCAIDRSERIGRGSPPPAIQNLYGQHLSQHVQTVVCENFSRSPIPWNMVVQLHNDARGHVRIPALPQAMVWQGKQNRVRGVMRHKVLVHEARQFEHPLNHGTVVGQTLGLESDGTEELMVPRYVIISDRHEHGQQH